MRVVSKIAIFVSAILMCGNLFAAVPHRTKLKPVAQAANTPVKMFKKTDVITLNIQNTYVMAGSINNLMIDQTITGIIGKRVLLDGIAGEDEPLYVVISSGGGYYQSALVFKNFMSNLSKMNVKFICDYCGSAAGMIFISAPVERIVTAGSQIMMHEMYQPRVTAAMIRDKEVVESLVKDSDNFNNIIYTVLGMTKEAYEARILEKEWNVYGKTAVDIKAADRAAIINCGPSLKAIANLQICK